MLITSLDNKKIKKYASLNNVRNRYKEKLFIVEGNHLCIEAEKANILTDILLLENTEITFKTNIEPTYVTKEILKKISSLPSPSNIIGICKLIENQNIKGNHILILDNVQDPGNIGTIIRSAKAFNIDTIILSEDSTDIYNDKVIRSTQGMLFHMNIIYANIKDAINKLKKEKYLILGTDVNNGISPKEIHPNKFALIMGNEGNGVNKDILNLTDKNIYIKMNQDCESLNVAVATSIILYELME